VAKEEKSTAQTKSNFFTRTWQRVRQYVQETVAELRKVNWPTRREAWYLTVIVLIVTGIMAIILGGFDWIFSKFFEWLLTLPVS
jgi:preprotein translocase subunit SecE